MNDLIERQAAISLAGDLQIHGDEYHMYNQAINNYCTEIMGLPPAQPDLPIKEKCAYCPHCRNCDVNDDLSIAQPERKKGKWMEIKNRKGAVIALRCDKCLMSPKNGVRSDFCPNCGADMRQREDDNV